MKQRILYSGNYSPQYFAIIFIAIGCLIFFVGLNYLSISAAMSTANNLNVGSDAIDNINGHYNGTLVITRPVNIGVVDITIQLTTTNGISTGYVVDSTTSHFSANPAVNASITGSTDGVTSTFTIESGLFVEVIAGQAITITRSFSITGDVLDDGNILRGTYSETIKGYTKKPLQIAGSVLLTKQTVRAAQTLPSSTPSSPTPVPTTMPPGSDNFEIYLPIIND